MNVDQCHWPKKMMGRGVDGGCGAEERPCLPFRRATLDNENGNKSSEDMGSPEIDFLAQASKNLLERSPFDVPEDGSTSGVSVPTLPIVLANLLNQSDNKKRHKKSHSGTEKKKKKSSRQGEKSRSGSIWVEHEDYFRRLELPDLEILSDLASLRSISSKNCFSVPSVGYESINIQQRETDASAKNEDGVCADGVVLEETKNLLRKEICEGMVKKEEVNVDVGQLMSVNNAGDEISSGSDYPGSLEWVLGCKNRILLTTERPSKKRKLLGGDAGLGKLMVAAPCEGNALLCDFCCSSDAKEYHHQLIFCSSCKAKVHRKCYGVLKDTDKAWLCSWCELENGRGDSERPCLLCPKKGGILKPVLSKTENGGPAEFAHLFCSLWMPKVYIEDLKNMEPILNFPGIKETRTKLLCNLCKVKSGACIRCCNGSCRTSFHPMCAREAGNRLEVWGKHGCETVELRAFCSKHSDSQESARAVEGGESNAADSRSPVCHLPSQSVKGQLGNDEMGVDVRTPGTGSDTSRNSELQERESPHSKLNWSATDNEESEMGNEDERTLSKSHSFGLILKKLIDLGKVDVKEVAAEIGVNPDALIAKLMDGDLLPDLLGKVVKWLSQHAHMATWNKGGNLKRNNTTKSERQAATCTEGIAMLDSGILDPAVTKAFSSVRTLESNICNNTMKNTICLSTENCTGNGIMGDEAKANRPVLEKEGSVSLAPHHPSEEQKTIGLDREVSLGRISINLSDDHGEQSNSFSYGVMLENACSLGVDSSQNSGKFNYPSPIILELLDHEAYPGFSPHPYIHKELSVLGKRQTLKSSTDYVVDRMRIKPDGSEEGNKHLQGAGEHTICCNHQSQSGDCEDTFPQLSEARKLDILDVSPEDEVEGELLYYQLRLLGTAVSRKQLSDNLVYEVAKKLPLEIDEQHGRRWDDVLVNKYFHDVREARKQGRKEKRHKQALSVLAAATAAAATSSRNTSLRKDLSEEPAQQEMSTSRLKVAGTSHLVPQTKETLLKMAVSGPPSEKRSDHRTPPDLSVENPRTCDICRRSETIWNLVVVCSSCKVAVHMDCYKCAKESAGPWYCELCAESSSEHLFNLWEKPYSPAECSLCGGTTGAFRKATNGQWVHAFCAEWSLESTFRRGQINPVQGIESLPKNMDTCCICQRIYGACIKCSYGNCQATFHPSCARSTGFHMTGGGKLPHKAYCEKHSIEQKAKAESQKHGAEELKSLKHYRVELERLRLLCERIVKREKLKRELAISSHEILVAKRDHAARSLHVRNPFSPPEVSSDSATTSIKGHPDSYISGSEAIQRSDDITIDSTVSVKRRGKGPMLMDTDQKTDDSATSKSRFSRKLTERQIFSGKTVPRKHCIVSPSVSEDGDKVSKPKKHVETFAKELLMTSDEASFKNRRLPKGYFYVPVDCLQEDKPGNQKAASSDKPVIQKTSSGDQSGKDG